MSGEGTPLLECRDLSAGYGRMAVVRGLDLRVEPGQVVALIGPNGAGKTTTLLTLSGGLPSLRGAVLWKGTRTREPLFKRARKGLSLVTEERSVFMDFTLAENLKVAGVPVERVLALFPELEPMMNRPAGLLSGGEQQMLTVGRALGRNPEVLLADELSLGLAPIIVRRLLGVVRQAATEQGIGVLLVEQHVSQVLTIADQVHVMQRGKVVLSGAPTEIGDRLSDLQDAYLADTTRSGTTPHI
ncbi:MAG: ABC transporter ATP-binding protein [Acidimicrobiia bacterium]|nr:ABC transporter ATP-binding protein [Acidimicrobiia bacterium]